MSVAPAALRSARDASLPALARRSGAFLALESPLACGVTRRLYWSVSPRLARRRHSTELAAYSVPLEPFRLVWVDPTRIDRRSRRASLAGESPAFGRVLDGEWDQRPLGTLPTGSDLFDGATITATPLYRAIEDCIVGERDWLETFFVTEVIDRLEDGQYPVWGTCRDRADVLERCGDLESQALELVCDGYRTQRELVASGELERRGYEETFANELTVDVARDGELLVANGIHRLSLARALGLERVAVAILARHRSWIEASERWWLAGETVDHPDWWGLRGWDRRNTSYK